MPLQHAIGFFIPRPVMPDVVPPVTYNDYFLPSKNELNEMYIELKLYSVGGFTNGSYYSSTEFNNNTVYDQDFGNGFQNLTAKDSMFFVRACRSFASIDISYNLRDVGPAGGLIFWKFGDSYLESAPMDQSVSEAWSNITNIEIGVSAQGTAIGTGQSNTLTIINQIGHTDSAAKLCDDLVV